MESVLDRLGVSSSNHQEGEEFFSTPESEEFSFEEVKYHIFKESLIFASLYYKFPLYLDNHDELMMHRLPIIKGLSFFTKRDEQLEHIYRADSLSHFLKIEKKKGRVLKSSSIQWKIKDIPLPVYVPDAFMEKLEKVILNLSEIGIEEEMVDYLKEGYNSFVDIIDIYKGKIYPLLFQYLRSENTEKQIQKRQSLLTLYNNTLGMIHEDKYLMLFCECMQIDTILKDIYKKKVEHLVPDAVNIKIKHLEMQELEDYFMEENDLFLSIDNEDILLFPLGFSSNFSLDACGFYGVSIKNTLLHYLPLVQLYKVTDPSLLEKWKSGIDSSDINRFFFFKQREALGAENAKSVKEEKIIEVININVQHIKTSVEKESRSILKKLQSRVFFKKLNSKEQIFKVLNIIRLSLEENSHMKIKINDSFYVNIQDEKLRIMIVEIMNEVFSVFLKGEVKTEKNKVKMEARDDN